MMTWKVINMKGLKLNKTVIKQFFKYLEKLECTCECEGYTLTDLGYNDKVQNVFIYLMSIMEED